MRNDTYYVTLDSDVWRTAGAALTLLQGTREPERAKEPNPHRNRVDERDPNVQVALAYARVKGVLVEATQALRVGDVQHAVRILLEEDAREAARDRSGGPDGLVVGD